MEQAGAAPDPTAAGAPGGAGARETTGETGEAPEQGRTFATIVASIARLDDLGLAGVEPASVFQW